MDAVVLDEEIVPLLELAPAFQLSVEALPAIRDARNVAMQVELSDVVERADHLVSDDPHVVVRVHRPKAVVGPTARVYSHHGAGTCSAYLRMDGTRVDRLSLHLS